MKFSSILAIFALFWSLSLFLVLPFRLSSGTGAEPHVPGQAESAPPRFSVARTAKWTTVVAAVLFGAYYLNYVYQWLPVERLNFVPDRVIAPR